MHLRINNNKEKKTSLTASMSNHQNTATAQFKDNRSEAGTQLKVQQMANPTIQRKENKTGMPDNLKTGIENLSGMDMGDVKVHYNSSKPAQLQAHAYAQGNQIHLGAGQEKHLPHEAWHVVQQKQGRVAPTKQLKEKMNINDDIGLEREADVMGAKALQFKSYNYSPLLNKFSVGKTIQLMTLSQAGLDTNFTENKTNTALFDTPRMKNGWQYNLNINTGKNHYQSVINDYTNHIRPLGNRLSTKKYTDTNFGKLISPITTKSGKYSKANRIILIDKLASDGIIKKDPYFDNFTNLSSVNNELSKKGDRDTIRQNDKIETIDPFISKIKLTPTSGANLTPWEIETQFADSGTGYITKIKKGDTDTTGTIDTKGGFNHTKDNATANKGDYSYSSTHEQTTGSFGSKVDSMNSHSIGNTKGKDHEGFDAITWMAAEGARFQPVKLLGGKASPQSLFFIIPNQHNWQKIKAVNLVWLMQNWGVEFNKKYNVSATTIKTKVIGNSEDKFPSIGHLYNLDTNKIIDAGRYKSLRKSFDWGTLLRENMITLDECVVIQKEERLHLKQIEKSNRRAQKSENRARQQQIKHQIKRKNKRN